MKTKPESKDNDEVGANYRPLWDKVFSDKEDCKHYWDGICGLKLIEKVQTDAQWRPVDEKEIECSFPCPKFEKGGNMTKELRTKLKREVRRL